MGRRRTTKILEVKAKREEDGAQGRSGVDGKVGFETGREIAGATGEEGARL